MKNPVIHFEMPYQDRERVAKFYHQAFGWDAEMLGEEMGNYVVVTTADGDAIPGAPAGAINGGFFQRGDDEAQHPSIVISVEDIHNAVDRVTQAGGTIQGKPMEIPGVGHYVAFLDTEGNRSGIMQSFPET